MTDKDFSANCAIQGDKGSGNGVFMTPKRVLTSWHVVQGQRTCSLYFKNSLGWVSTMKPAKEGGKHLFDADLDIALVELKLPIGLGLALPPQGLPRVRDAFDNARAVLKASFDGNMNSHELAYRSLDSLGHRADRNAMNFLAHIAVVPGYSGSPIFGEDGMTLVSIVKAIAPDEQRHAAQFREVFSRAGMARSEPDIPLLGVRPDLLARWYRKAAAELNI
jgi:hypothetical protein